MDQQQSRNTLYVILCSNSWDRIIFSQETHGVQRLLFPRRKQRSCPCLSDPEYRALRRTRNSLHFEEIQWSKREYPI